MTTAYSLTASTRSRVSFRRPSQFEPASTFGPCILTTPTPSTVRLAVVDSITSQTLPNLAITPTNLTLRPSQSPFHTLKATLTATRSAAPLPKTFRLLLSVASEGKGKAVAEGERDNEWIKQVIGEVGQEVVANWNEDKVVFLRALSGEVEVRETKAGENAVADMKGEHRHP